MDNRIYSGCLKLRAIYYRVLGSLGNVWEREGAVFMSHPVRNDRAGRTSAVTVLEEGVSLCWLTLRSHQQAFRFPVLCMGECLVELGSCIEL